MTVWLWVIGGTAFVWPIVVAIYLDREFTRWVEADNRADACIANQRDARLLEHLSKVHGVAEEHEALIVALWQKTFGFRREGRFSEAELPRHLGVKPDWQGFTREFSGPVNYVVRYNPFPWGTSPEHLNIAD